MHVQAGEDVVHRVSLVANIDTLRFGGGVMN